VTASSNISASSIIDTSPASAQAAFSRFGCLITFYILRQVRFGHQVQLHSYLAVVVGDLWWGTVCGTLHGSIEAQRSAALELAPFGSTLSRQVELGCALIDNFPTMQDNLKILLQWQLP